MSGDMNAVFAAIAVMAKQNQEQAEEIDGLKKMIRLHDERIDAHGQLLIASHQHGPARRRHYEAMLAEATI